MSDSNNKESQEECFEYLRNRLERDIKRLGEIAVAKSKIEDEALDIACRIGDLIWVIGNNKWEVVQED